MKSKKHPSDYCLSIECVSGDLEFSFTRQLLPVDVMQLVCGLLTLIPEDTRVDFAKVAAESSKFSKEDLSDNNDIDDSY